MIIERGAVPVFIQLLSSHNEELRDQAVWAIGNIAGDSPEFRDYVLQQGVLHPLLQLLQLPNNKLSLIRNAAWTLSNFCRGKPAPKLNAVVPAIPMLAQLLKSSDDEVIADAAWSFSYLSDADESAIDAIISSGVCQTLVYLLSHPSSSVQTPALRTVGNICTGNDRQTQILLDLNVLPSLGQLLNSQRKTIRKETCWTLSNITAGTKIQTQHVINSGLFPELIRQLDCSEFEVRKEAAWAISNATTWKVPEQIKSILGWGAAKPMIQLLASNDTKLILVVLEFTENVLSTGEMIANQLGQQNMFVNNFEEVEAVDKLDQLQSHSNNEIYKKSVSILEKYFGAVDETNDENMAPAPQQQQSVFSFTPQQQNQFSGPTGGFVF